MRCGRTLRLQRNLLVIEDQLQGSGNHKIDLFFHLGPEWKVSTTETNGKMVGCAIAGSRRLTLNCKADDALQFEVENSEISRAYGSRIPATRIQVSTVTQLPATLVTCIEWNRQ